MKSGITSLCFFILLSVSVNAQTWWQLNSGTASDLMEINFSDNNTVFCFGDSAIGPTFMRGIVLKTTDKGANWDQQNMISPEYKILDSYFFNSGNGIAVGRHNTLNGVVCRTSNGGSTWVVDSSFAERIHSVHFTNANTGWIAGRNGYAAKTVNAGINWNTLTTGTGDHLNGVFFTDLNNGYAVGDQGGTETILHTTNGGNSWTPQSSGVIQHMNDVWCVGAGNCWAVGNAGTIIYTSDSGNIWTPQVSNTTGDLLDVQFLNANEGWATGTGGTLLNTTDGGNTWNPVTSNTTNDIQSISMISNSEGWFCGNGGDIYYYGLSIPNSVNEISKSGKVVNIFPNPMDDRTTVFIEGFKGSYTIITLFDVLGNKIYQSRIKNNQPFTMQRNDLKSGAYFYKIINELNESENGIIIIK